MRDYNQIPFRSPSQTKNNRNNSQYLQHPHSPTEKVSSTTASTSASSNEHPHDASPPFRSTSPTPQTGTSKQQQSQSQQQLSPKPTSTQSSGSMSPNDALLLRREGPEAVITKLRQQLEQATAESQSSKSALSKSEAVAHELKSTVRQLKRQIESLKQQQQSKTTQNRAIRDGDSMPSRDAEIGELQVQLDKAHAQILTADMVRKELEDTLEAEQYTWELRVQDQERTIIELQAAVSALQKQLEKNKNGSADTQQLLRELEQARQEIEHYKKNGSGDTNELHERILSLEQERSELQGCLDEALKELEAVDAELQQDSSALLREENERLQKELERQKTDGAAVEPLQHLHRWILEREGQNDSTAHQLKNPSDLVKSIKLHLEQDDLSSVKVKELESQISVYRGDLKAREESSTELRASLKEAVALLKPLQDAVAKADKEKTRLTDQLEKAKANAETSQSEIKRYKDLLNLKDDEIDRLRQEIESLELQLSKAKLEAASSVARSIGSPGDGYGSPGGEDTDGSFTSGRTARAKRKSEETLKKMLSDAQSRFSTLNEQAQQVEARNSELQGRLSRQMQDTSLQQKIAAHEQRIHELENEASVREGELARKDVVLRNLQDELEEAHSLVRDLKQKNGSNKEMQAAKQRLQELEEELNAKNKDLSAKKEAHRALNKSLKDALGLIKPLQYHLAEAEQEKRELAEELDALKWQSQNDSSTMNGSRSVPTNGRHADDTGNDDKHAAAVRHLENTVQQLERENSKLQDALEDMSQTINASHISQQLQSPQQKEQASRIEAKLRAELVELKSRYEVTQGRLEDSFVENHSLVEALKKREQEENAMVKELEVLREQLATSKAELESAKYIATASLVKIDQMNHGESIRRSGKSHDDLYREKRSQMENELQKLI